MIAMEEGLTTLCSRALPDWTSLRVTDVSPLPPRPSSASVSAPLRSLALIVEGGSKAQSYRKELVWRCHAERESCWALDDRERAEREFLLLRALEARGFPVPHAYAWGREGGGWVLMESVSGRPATSVTARQDALRWLRRLHSVAAESIPQAPLPHVTLVGTLVRARTWGEEAECAEVCDAAEACLRRPALPEATGHLLHGDPHPDRYRVEHGRVIGWLGWATAAVGDPRWDLAQLLSAEDGMGQTGLPLYAAASALRDWSATACRTTCLSRERGAEHPSVLARAPLVARLRRRCLTAVTAL